MSHSARVTALLAALALVPCGAMAQDAAPEGTPAAETPAAPAEAPAAPAETPAAPAEAPAAEAPAAPAETPAAPEAEAEAPEAEAKAPAAQPDHRVTLSHLDVIRLNPLGLESQNRLMHVRPLNKGSDSILFQNTFGAYGLGLKLNPAFFKVGPVFEMQPIAVLNLRISYEFMQFFGTFDFVQSFAEPTDPDGYADDNRADNADSAYVTNGHHVLIEPTLQAKVGNVAIRSKFAFEWWDMDLQNNDRVWYDATLDTYVPGEGFVITNDTDVLYLAGDLVAGARLSWVNPIYRDDHFVSGSTPDGFDGASHLRVGPIVVYSLSKREEPKPVQHRVLGTVAWYLSHPNREGAMPYILLGYAYTRDL